jgi:hypothetical protein
MSQDLLEGEFSSILALPRGYFITRFRLRQHVRRNREADLLRGFSINYEHELGRLLYGNIRCSHFEQPRGAPMKRAKRKDKLGYYRDCRRLFITDTFPTR